MSRGLQYWGDAVEGVIDPAAVMRLLNDPGYENVLRRATSGALTQFDAQSEAHMPFRDIGTFGLGLFALHLDAQGGLTHRRLAALSTSSAILSSGRASALLGLMRVKGLVQREADAPRGGAVRYLPTSNLTRVFNSRIKIEFDALAPIEPALTPFLAVWDAPGVFRNFIGVFGAKLTRAQAAPTPELEPMRRIGTHRAGFLMLYDLLMRADRGGVFPSTDPFEIGVSDIARRFSVGRAQVRRTLKQMEDSGFLMRESDAGRARFSPAFQTQLKRYSATLHVALMASAYDALQTEN